MKTLGLLSLILSCAFLTACGKEASNSPLVGTWMRTSFQCGGEVNTTESAFYTFKGGSALDIERIHKGMCGIKQYGIYASDESSMSFTIFKTEALKCGTDSLVPYTTGSVHFSIGEVTQVLTFKHDDCIETLSRVERN